MKKVNKVEINNIPDNGNYNYAFLIEKTKEINIKIDIVNEQDIILNNEEFNNEITFPLTNINTYKFNNVSVKQNENDIVVHWESNDIFYHSYTILEKYIYKNNTWKFVVKKK